uniref:Uncharacterized protein n=1 Tax=Anopheles christyi TaxID=43041 RepID=A0A182KIH9_9DIPT
MQSGGGQLPGAVLRNMASGTPTSQQQQQQQ